MQDGYGILNAIPMQKNKQYNRPTNRHKKQRVKPRWRQESDGQYLLKLVLVILLGTLWVKFAAPLQLGAVMMSGVPVGMIIALLLIRRYERKQTDRKIWYAILLVITIICYFVPAGIMV